MLLEKLRIFNFVFIRCFAFSFTSLGVSYFVLRGIYGESPVGPPAYTFIRIRAYWELYPLQYIAVVCLCYALLAGLWATFLECPPPWFRALQICGILITTIFFSSFACGALWALHDMQAGYFPSWMWGKILENAKWGLNLGPRMVNNSFPLNLIALVLGYIIIDQISRIKTNPKR